MYKENGISLIFLIIVIVIIGVIAFNAFQYTKDYVKNQETEDIKQNMLTVQGIIKNSKNKHIVDKESDLLGTKLNLENNETEYHITEDFKNVLQTLEEPELYILSQDDLNNSGIKNITIDNEKYYVVDYNSQEVFYSVGINGKYKLSELE